MERPKSGLTATVFSAFLRPLVRLLDKGSLPKYRGTLELAGLTEKVRVYWQAHGIPHVHAATEADLFFAQGYLHAQERLWQMETSRRFLSGRLAELFGAFPVPWKELSSQFRDRNSADLDYFMRLMGIRRAAAASLQLCSDLEHQRLQAYSEGVNRYIEQCGTRLPWEFRLLRFEPEAWRPEDSFTIGKGLAFFLSTALFTRLNMIAVSARLASSQSMLRSLYPFYPDDGQATTRAVWNAAENIWRFMNGGFARSDWGSLGQGSNNWVVAPRRSATGRPILCNDPHLRLAVPSMWYLMHLKAEPSPSQADGYEVWGASIPGAPCIQLGHNRWISWGATAALCDDVELYREKTHPLDPDRYLLGRHWLAMEKREEFIGIRKSRPMKKTIRSTCHGPILSDFAARADPLQILSFRWTAHEASREFGCVYGVNQARDWRAFLESLSEQTAPALNYVYADCDGNIGYSLAGKIPLRPEIPSLLPLDGWREGNHWHGYIPFGELPRLYNPPEGVIATANNRIVDDSYPHYVSQFFEPPYRIRRIKQLLMERDSFSLRDMETLQTDHVSLHAVEVINAVKPVLARLAAENPQLKIAADRLLQWDGACGEKSVAAALFHVFHHRLMANLLIPALGEELFFAYVEIFNHALAPVDRILRDPASPWFSTTSREQLVARSLREACAELERRLGSDMELWEWGKIHELSLNHALSRVKPLRPLLSIGPMPSPGDGTTINMGFYRHSNPYAQTVGASLRFVIDVGGWQQSGFVLPSGQSGHPSSAHYGDQTPLWRSGRNTTIGSCDESGAESTLLLIPPSGALP
jgi:penicillin G amidase